MRILMNPILKFRWNLNGPYVREKNRQSDALLRTKSKKKCN